eukprot:CCRYP_021092-RA/>CCRYP_021092-RA protein AED:0.43 eAED:0.43 QI:0/-1/0/1/-1/1/1/0/203
MVTTGTKHAIQCGDFTDTLKEWARLPKADKTWLDWKNHWTRAFKVNRDIQRLTGCTFCHHANSAVEDDLSLKMVSCFDNLASATVQKNDNVKKLVTTNKQLTETIHKLHEQNAKLHILEKYAGTTEAKPVSRMHAYTGSGDVWDPSGYCGCTVSSLRKGTTVQHAKLDQKDIGKVSHVTTQWRAAKPTLSGHRRLDGAQLQDT